MSKILEMLASKLVGRLDFQVAFSPWCPPRVFHSRRVVTEQLLYVLMAAASAKVCAGVARNLYAVPPMTSHCLALTRPKSPLNYPNAHRLGKN